MTPDDERWEKYKTEMRENTPERRDARVGSMIVAATIYIAFLLVGAGAFFLPVPINILAIAGLAVIWFKYIEKAGLK